MVDFAFSSIGQIHLGTGRSSFDEAIGFYNSKSQSDSILLQCSDGSFYCQANIETIDISSNLLV